MKKVVRIFVLAILFFSIALPLTVQAAPPAPDHPWVTEFIDSNDIDVNSGISMTRIPVINKLAVAYAGIRPDLGHRILKFALQVAPGKGNCGHYDEWECTDVDTSEGVGLYNSIAASVYIHDDNIIFVGISYWDQKNGALKFAENIYEIPTRDWWGWNVMTIEKDDRLFFAGQASSLTYDRFTGAPVIAYRAADQIGTPGQKLHLKTATYVGGGFGNCADGGSWLCEIITSEPFAYADSFKHISTGWVDDTLYFFYNSRYGLDYAYRYSGTLMTNCSNQDFACFGLDRDNNHLGKELKAVSWSGNRPGASGYNSQVRENGVYLTYMDLQNQRLKYAYYAKSGEPTNCGYFVCNPVMDLEATQYQSMSITMDPNYFPAITYSKFDPYVSNYGVSLFTARPKAAYGGGAWGSCEGDPFSKWRCEPVFVADDNTEAGGWAAIDISSSNLGRIVYVDFDRMGGTLGLAYLRQEGYKLALPVIRK